MDAHIAEDDLLDLARGGKPLGDAPACEAHLADCSDCSALLVSLLVDPAAAGAGAAAPRDLVGRTLGPYRLDSLIGAGAMGEVYRAWDTRLDRFVALKALPQRFAESPDRVRRLEAEARAAAKIAHPNVVTVYDTGTDGGVSYIVSELIAGESLRSVLDRGPVPRRRALELGRMLAQGLAAAHAQGVVHRDLKPMNLIVTDNGAEDGALKILDFGLAKLGSTGNGDRDVEATEPGTLLGTAGYLSPEQARGEPADARSDLFAVGAILYELLSGRRAFAGATFAERLSGVLRDTPPPLEGDPASPVVLRCLEKDPKKRFQSANDLAWVLADLPAGAPAKKPRIDRRTFLVAAATGLGGLALGRALAPARTPFVADYRQLTFRQGRVASARFTPDGGSVLHSDAWDELPLALTTSRLDGGGTRPLDLPSGQLLAVSSRGSLALSVGHRPIRGFHQRGELTIVPLEGGEPRSLGLDVQHADFTPDGADLAVVRREAGAFRLELPIGKVLHEAGWLSHPRVAPDGKLVAVLVHDSPLDDRGRVALVPADGRGPVRQHDTDWSAIDGLAWAPNGKTLWVSASRAGGNNAIRALDLDGRELARVPSAGRLRIQDVARDGRLAVTQVTARMRMMVKAPGAEREVDLALSDVSLVADIAADGSSIVFAEFGDVDTANGAYLRSTTGGTPLRLGEGLPRDLADDGRGVLATTYVESEIVVFPTGAGQARPLVLPGLTDVRWARWCKGGVLVGADRRIWRADTVGGTPTPLTEPSFERLAAVSPDGERAAFVREGQLHVLAVAGGALATVGGRFDDCDVCGWRSAGEVYLRSAGLPVEIRRVALADSAATHVRTIDPPRLGRRGVDSVVIDESGDGYAYSYGQELSRLYTMTAQDPGA